MAVNSNKKIAVLIDGDNAEARLIEQILNEASKFGRVTIKRIYADWTMPQMNKWKDQTNGYAIRPIQKFSYTKGKNSTDTALIIDAMDIMYQENVDGFCIVSSDSDYTGIAHRIREAGLYVMGIGGSHTPEAFVKACEHFVFTEILMPDHPKPVIQKKKRPAPKLPSNKTLPVEEKVLVQEPVTEETISQNFSTLINKVTRRPLDISLVDNAFNIAADDITGLALASQLGNELRKIDSSFDVRNYGFNSLRKFIEALKPRYEIVFTDKTTVSVKRTE
ncbi:MAG: NYN domain-containing protein [Chitinophagaceae bacterium]